MPRIPAVTYVTTEIVALEHQVWVKEQEIEALFNFLCLQTSRLDYLIWRNGQLEEQLIHFVGEEGLPPPVPIPDHSNDGNPSAW